MKTKQFFLLIVAAAFAANVFATDVPTMNIAPMKDAKALISIASTLPEVLELSITNKWDEMMYYKKSTKKIYSYQKVFDLSHLEPGTYRLTVKSGDATIKNDLLIKDSKVVVLHQRKEMKPFFSTKDASVILSYLNFHNEEMTVRVYDTSDCIFTKKLGDDLAMHRIINLEELWSGNYHIVLADKHNEYWFSFSR